MESAQAYDPVAETFAEWHIFFPPSFVGEPFYAKKLIHNAVSNIICCLVFGERFEYSDKQYHAILKSFDRIIQLQGDFMVQVRPFFNVHFIEVFT